MFSTVFRTPVEVVVEQVEGEDLYLIMVATHHHAFTLSRSSTFRTLKDFYFLKRTLAVCWFGEHFPHAAPADPGDACRQQGGAPAAPPPPLALLPRGAHCQGSEKSKILREDIFKNQNCPGDVN